MLLLVLELALGMLEKSKLILFSDTLTGKNFWLGRWNLPLSLCWYVYKEACNMGRSMTVG